MSVLCESGFLPGPAALAAALLWTVLLIPLSVPNDPTAVFGQQFFIVPSTERPLPVRRTGHGPAEAL